MALACGGASTGVAAEPPAQSALTFDASNYAAATGYMAGGHLHAVGNRVFAAFQRGTLGTPAGVVLRWTDEPLASVPSWSAAVELDATGSAHPSGALAPDESALYYVSARAATQTGGGRNVLFRRLTNLTAASPTLGAAQTVLSSTSTNAYTHALVAADGAGHLWLSVRFNDGGVLTNRIYVANAGSDAPAWTYVRDAGTPTTKTKAWPLALRHVGDRVVFVYADPDAPTSGTYATYHLDADPVSTWASPALVSSLVPTSPAWDGTSTVTTDGTAMFVGFDTSPTRFGIFRYDSVPSAWSTFGSLLGQDGALATSSNRLALAIRETGSLYLRDSPLETESWTPSQLIGEAGTDIQTARLPMLASTKTWWIPAVWSHGKAPNVSIRFQTQVMASAPDTTPPDPVTVADPSSVTSAGFTLSWTAAADSGGIARYLLDIATDDAFTAPVSGYDRRDIGNVLTHTAGGLAPGTTYWVRVFAEDSSGNVSGASNVVSATTAQLDTTAPTAPVLSDPANPTGSTLDVSWCCAGDDTGVASYRLDAATDAAFTTFVEGWNDRDVGSATTVTVTGLAPGTTYWFRARAVDAAGNVSPSSASTSGSTNATTRVVLIPTEDASVESNRQQQNFGSSPVLLARFDPEGIAYLKFDAGTFAGWGVQAAHLRLTADDGSLASAGQAALSGDTAWSEATLTWKNKPAIEGPVVDILGGVAAGAVADFDVTAAFSGAALPGLLTLTVASGASDDMQYRSREAETGRPELVLDLVPTSTATAPHRLIRGPYVQNMKSTQATIVWRTPVASPGAVRYGTTALDAVQADGIGTVHAVTLAGLTPGTTYQYVVEAGAAVLSDVLTFKTAPAPGGSFTFAAFGDSGIGNADQMAIAARLDAVAPDLVTHLGDIVYPNSARISWDPYLFLPYRQTMRSAAVFPAFGNHEVPTENGQPFLDYFYLPTNSVDFSERYYSFDYGDAHFVALNTEESLVAGSPQYQWLEADLQATTKPWKIAFMHKVIYSNSSVHPGNAELQENLGPLFSAYGVQLVLSGHAHSYERSHPQGGVTYVVSGGGGAGLYSVGTGPTTAFSASVHHLVKVSMSTAMLTLQAVLANGSVLDSWSVSRDSTPPSPGTMQPATSITSSSFTASWSAATDNTGIDHYLLDVASDSGFTSPVPGYSSRNVGNVLSAPVSGLSPSTRYWMRHRAVDGAGNVSAFSNVVDATTAPPPEGDADPPVIGTLASPFGVEATAFTLTWTAAGDEGGISHYLLDVASNAGFTSFVPGYAARNVGNVLETPVSGLSPGTEYWSRVRAVDFAGNVSSYSNVVAATTAVVFDSFSRTVSSGWGTVDGMAWSLSGNASDFSVDGSAGRIDESTTGSRTAVLGFSRRDVSVLARFQFVSLPGTSWNGFYALARASGSDTWYGARVRSVAGGSDDIEFNLNSASTGLIKIGSTAMVPEFAAGGWYLLRLEAVGDGTTTTLRARVWSDGAPEPSAWSIATTDSRAALQGPAGGGVRCTANSTSAPARCAVDTFSVFGL